MLSLVTVALIIVSFHSNRTMTKTEAGTRDWGYFCSRPNHDIKGIWKTLELWTRKVARIFKLELRGHPIRNMEDNSIKGNVDGESPFQEVSEGKNISKQPKCHFYDIRQRMWLLILKIYLKLK